MRKIGGYKRIPIQKSDKPYEYLSLGETRADLDEVFCGWEVGNILMSRCRSCDYCKGIGREEVWCGWWGYQSK